jgi:hypothetical protein
MKVWVLILYIQGYHAGGVTTVEFATEEACKSAIEQVKAASNMWAKPQLAVCVRKDAP